MDESIDLARLRVELADAKERIRELEAARDHLLGVIGKQHARRPVNAGAGRFCVLA